jgi:hypothetical protein
LSYGNLKALRFRGGITPEPAIWGLVAKFKADITRRASSKAFSERLAKPRVMYATESALKAIGNGIKYCIEKKAKPKYTGFDLLIEAPLRSLPSERWNHIQEELRSAASTMPFRQIQVIGNQDTEPFGFRIK